MPNYKLIYFNGKGRAEIVRFVFVQAGVEYEDVRVTGEEFGKMKPTLPAGSLPVLEVDGEQLAGSGVITRYLAEEYGLAGSNALENAQIASFCDVINDLSAFITPAFFGTEESKAAGLKALLEKEIPKYFAIMEKRIKENKSGNGWVYGDKITYADLRLCVTVDGLMALNPTMADDYPALKNVNEKVKAEPKIAEWLKKRPDTPF